MLQVIVLFLLLSSVYSNPNPNNYFRFPEINIANTLVPSKVRTFLDNPKVPVDSKNFESKYVDYLLYKFKEDGQDKSKYQLNKERLINNERIIKNKENKLNIEKERVAIKRFIPNVNPYTIGFWINNRRYYTLSKMAYNMVIRDKYFSDQKDSNLVDIEINYGLKLTALLIIDVILSFKNFDFILLRIYYLLKTVDINQNKPMNTDMIGTIILVMYNTLNSYKPILYSNVLYVYFDLIQDKDWNPFNRISVERIAVELGFIESEEKKIIESVEQEILHDQEGEIDTEQAQELAQDLKSKGKGKGKGKGEGILNNTFELNKEKEGKEAEIPSNTRYNQKDNQNMESKFDYKFSQYERKSRQYNDISPKSRNTDTEFESDQFHDLLKKVMKMKLKNKMKHTLVRNKALYGKDYVQKVRHNNNRVKSVAATKNSMDLGSYMHMKQVHPTSNHADSNPTVSDKYIHNDYRFKSQSENKIQNTAQSHSNLRSRSKSIEEEVEFEETFNNNRNYWLFILTLVIISVNTMKIFSLIFVAIIMFAIEEKDQQQLISDQMIVDQFATVFFKIEDSFVDEDSQDTFNLVNESLFIPDAQFKQWIYTIEIIYDLINPVLASFQSNFMKNIFIRHMAGLIFGIKNLYFGEMLINYSEYFSQKNIESLCVRYRLDAYYLIQKSKEAKADDTTHKGGQSSESSRFKMHKDKADNTPSNIVSGVPVSGSASGSGDTVSDAKTLPENSKIQALRQKESTMSKTYNLIDKQQTNMENELKSQNDYITDMNNKLTILFAQVGIEKKKRA